MSVRAAAAYMTTKMPMLMYISSCVSVSGSLTRRRLLPLFPDIQLTPSFLGPLGAEGARRRRQRFVRKLLTTGEPATTMMMITIAL